MGVYSDHIGAAWTSWAAGIIAAGVTAAAVRPAIEAHHKMMPSH